MKLSFWGAALSVGVVLSSCEAQVPPATVVSVGDGDGATIRRQGKTITIRLACIDAPETAQQPWGQQSALRLKQLLPVGQAIQIREIETDKYGRTVAELYKGNQSVNLQMVKEGQAVVFRQYLDNCADTKDQYLQAEAQAQQKKLGFWNQPDPICMPGAFRRNQCFASSPPPTSTPKPTPRSQPGTPTPSASYPPSCVTTDCNCSDFRDQEDAQRVLDDPNYPNDPFGLDGPIGSGSTGVPEKACESLPARL